MKWASREAVDVYFKAKSLFQLGARTIRAGEPVLIFDSVKTSTLEVGAEISYVTGGRGNNRLLSFEGDKTLTFQFEDALLSNEGLAILSGADLIPARNKHLKGAGTEATSVIAHYTEKYSVVTGNRSDGDPSNIYDVDTAIADGGQIPQGGELNVWLTKKPYVGQNASIYVMLLDDAGEMSGAPIQINLDNVGYTTYTGTNATPEIPAANQLADAAALTAKIDAANLGQIYLRKDNDKVYKIVSDGAAAPTYSAQLIGVGSHHSFLAKFRPGDHFIAFGSDNQPIAKFAVGTNADHATFPDFSVASAMVGYTPEIAGQFDDAVQYYVFVTPDELTSATAAVPVYPSWWTTAYFYENAGVKTTFSDFVREIDATGYGSGTWGQDLGYSYLLAPSGGVAQPRCFKNSNNFYYKANVPSILYQDILLLDYYEEYEHDATQVSILPDKFGPFMYVEGSTLVRRASDGTDLPCNFVIPKFKVTTALTFTMQGTGDASTFTFQGDAYPDYSKFDLTRKTLCDIQILDADDNYDGASAGSSADPTSYRRFQYNNDSEGEYIWKDPSMDPHNNMDYSDIPVQAGSATLNPDFGGPATRTPGDGNIDAHLIV